MSDPTISDPTDKAGSEFGPYRLDVRLGQGGMGEVYKAYDTSRDRIVALKLLGGKTADDGTFEERFRRECKAVAKLGEPHIIPIHDYGEIDGTLYLDMRLVDGQNLREVLRTRGSLPADEAVSIIEQVAAALDAAHEAGVVHRDVKPENMLMTPEGFVYLVDFGVAHAEGADQLTKTGMAIGSTAYIAPEQFDDAPVTAATDTYALAAVFYELLTGRPPHSGESVSSIIKSAVLNDAPAPSSVNPAVPPALDAVLAHGLAKAPGSRYSSSGAFAAAARGALNGEPADAATGLIGPGVAPQSTHAYSDPAYPLQGGGPGYSGPQYPAAPYPGASGPQYPGGQYSGPQYAGQFSGPQYAGPGYPEPQKSGTRTAQLLLVGLIGLLVIGLIGLGIYYLMFHGKGGANSASTTTVTSTLDTPVPTGPPAGSRECAPGVAADNQRTTCPFAINVRDAYLQGGQKGEARSATASSPATGQTYTMNCAPDGAGYVTCRGGVNAIVHIW